MKRTNQQWDALCAAWNQTDAALFQYLPARFSDGTDANAQRRSRWLACLAIAARQSTGWLRLPEEGGECVQDY